jgi:predicted DNA-binding protein with PD1-like motif
MEVILRDNRRYILRIDKGEEVFSSLLEFADRQNVLAAAFQGIGACGEVEMGDFDLKTKTYNKHTIKENLEIISLIGNIAVLDNKPALHAHGSFGRPDLSVLGGHVFKVVVSVTCEIFLIKLDGDLQRNPDKDSNLNLLS